MKLTSAQLDSLMELIGRTREGELDCDQCLERISEFAELQLAGQPVPEALRAVEHHLALCAECREEYEALRLALAGLRQEGGAQ